MPKNDAYQRLLREAFKELDMVDMVEHMKWELDHFYTHIKKLSDDSKPTPKPKTTVEKIKSAIS